MRDLSKPHSDVNCQSQYENLHASIILSEILICKFEHFDQLNLGLHIYIDRNILVLLEYIV